LEKETIYKANIIPP